MSLAGLKKQLNKANQYVVERMGGAEATKVSDQFVAMETQTDLTNQVVQQMIDRTKELLHPNPALRARVSVHSKLKGTRKERYPHPERSLADVMLKYGAAIGKNGHFGQSLIEMGVTLKEVTEIRYTMEDTVKQKFLEPLTHLQLKDIKDCLHHRKKLEGRRLDYDCKRRRKLKGLQVVDSELKTAADKYNESLRLATVAMQHLIDHSDTAQVDRLAQLSAALYDYHNQCAQVFGSLTARLRRRADAQKESDVNSVWSSARNAIDAIDTAVTAAVKDAQPFRGVTAFIPISAKLKEGLTNSKSVAELNRCDNRCQPLRPIVGWKSANELRERAVCRALYDFEAENNDELTFKEGDLIQLSRQIDDHWFEGSVDGRSGLFPISYVQVLTPLP